MIAARQLASLAPGAMELETVRLDEAPPPGAILARADTTAISPGTEVANYLGRTTQRGPDSTDRYVPGYSFAGTVLAVGEGVERFAAGDRICGPLPHASHAVEGRPERLARITRIPDGVSAEQASLTQLACIVLNGIRIARIELGERVAVVGAGLIGLLSLPFARLAGARGIVALDPIAGRRAVAERYGATAALAPDADALALAPEGFDVVVEASGAPAAVTPALRLARRGGRVVLLGSTRGVVDSFDPYADVHKPGLKVLGAHVSTTPTVATPDNRWVEAANRELILDLLRTGDLDVAPLITDRVPPSGAPAAFAALAAQPDAHLGVLIDWTREPGSR